MEIYLIVIDYQGDEQRFWSGRRWVTDASDAWCYDKFGAARAMWRKLPATVRIVENYGLTTERIVL